MATQTDPPNVQTIVHNTTGAEINRYFGCWLDINQPGQTHFPLNPTNDGPYGGSLNSILQLVRNQHQCLVAEIAFDPAPVSTGATPGSSDKLAQRNLSLVASANPGDIASRRIPVTFELKPTQSKPPQEPDELMIDWGNTPAGSIARIYLPDVSADEVLDLAAKRYSAANLTRVDEHTIETAVQQVTYVPIPLGPSLNQTGLITMDMPEGVKEGQLFTIVVRQITQAGRAIPNPQEPVIDASVAERSFAVARAYAWKRVLGTFQISIPVQSKASLIAPEERLLSVLLWILKSINPQDRWYPAFLRYVEEVANRVRGLGGKPELVQPSPTGEGGRPDEFEEHEVPDELEDEAHRAFMGKVPGLIFDHFGDFEGFLLETKDGERRFLSREQEVEALAERAWRERLRLTVWAARAEPHRPLRIIVREPPAPFPR
jgi:hypothetical protein